MNRDRVNEVVGILLLALAVLVVVSLLSYEPWDIGLLSSHPTTEIANRAGVIGVYLAHGLVNLFGRLGGWAVPILLVIWAIHRIWGRGRKIVWVKALGTLVLVV